MYSSTHAAVKKTPFTLGLTSAVNNYIVKSNYWLRNSNPFAGNMWVWYERIRTSTMHMRTKGFIFHLLNYDLLGTFYVFNTHLFTATPKFMNNIVYCMP